MASQGTFIVFEGGDGSGKTTQVELLKERLKRDDILYVSDPGGTEIGFRLREMVKYQEALTERAELFLFLTARAQLAEEIIVPALKEGKHVISNRYDLSTIAYQIYGRNNMEGKDLLLAASDYARMIEPNLYIYLDVPVSIAYTRIQAREERTRFEREEIAFHERIHTGYEEHLKSRNHARIDGTKPIDDVYKDVEKAVLGVIGS